MYEDIKEYLNWYDTRKDVTFAKDAPIIGLVLQRSHLVTGDEGHYSGVVSEMEARGAKVGSDSNRSSCQAKRALVWYWKSCLFEVCIHFTQRAVDISILPHATGQGMPKIDCGSGAPYCLLAAGGLDSF